MEDYSSKFLTELRDSLQEEYNNNPSADSKARLTKCQLALNHSISVCTKLKLFRLYESKFTSLDDLLEPFGDYKSSIAVKNGTDNRASKGFLENALKRAAIVPVPEGTRFVDRESDMSNYRIFDSVGKDTISVGVAEVTREEWWSLLNECLGIERTDLESIVKGLVNKFERLNKILIDYKQLHPRRPLQEVAEIHPLIGLQLDAISRSIKGALGPKIVACGDNYLTVKLLTLKQSEYSNCTIKGHSDLAVLSEGSTYNLDNVIGHVECKPPEIGTEANTLNTLANSEVLLQALAHKAMKGDGKAQKALLSNFSHCKIAVVAESDILESGEPKPGHHIILTRKSKNRTQVVLQLLAFIFVDAQVLYKYLNDTVVKKELVTDFPESVAGTVPTQASRHSHSGGGEGDPQKPLTLWSNYLHCIPLGDDSSVHSENSDSYYTKSTSDEEGFEDPWCDFSRPPRIHRTLTECDYSVMSDISGDECDSDIEAEEVEGQVECDAGECDVVDIFSDHPGKAQMCLANACASEYDKENCNSQIAHFTME